MKAITRRTTLPRPVCRGEAVLAVFESVSSRDRERIPADGQAAAVVHQEDSNSLGENPGHCRASSLAERERKEQEFS